MFHQVSRGKAKHLHSGVISIHITQETTVTPNLLRGLRIPPNSLLTPKLKGLDLTDRNGIRRFVQVIESPKNMVNINDDVYTGILDKLYADGYGAEIDAARQEMQVENISATKQGQQEQTRQFAFGVPDVTRPDAAPSGGSPSVVSEPAATGVAPPPAAPERGGDVSTQPDVGDTVAREEQQPTTLTLYRGVPKGRESQETVGGALFMSPDKSIAETYAGEQGAVAEETVAFNNMLSAPTWAAARKN